MYFRACPEAHHREFSNDNRVDKKALSLLRRTFLGLDTPHKHGILLEARGCQHFGYDTIS